MLIKTLNTLSLVRQQSNVTSIYEYIYLSAHFSQEHIYVWYIYLVHVFGTFKLYQIFCACCLWKVQ